MENIVKNTTEKWEELKEIGLTEKVLADIVGTTQSNVSRLMLGNRGKYSLYASHIKLAIYMLHDQLAPAIKQHKHSKNFIAETVKTVKVELTGGQRKEQEYIPQPFVKI